MRPEVAGHVKFAESREGRFRIEFRVPILNRFVRYLLAPISNCVGRQRVDHVKDVRCDAFGDLQHSTQRLRAEHGRVTQWCVTQDRGHERFELFIRRPATKCKLFEIGALTERLR